MTSLESFKIQAFCSNSLKYFRSVLAATCPYFKGMFTNNLTESNQEEVELKGCTYEAVEVLVNYLYTGKAIVTEYNTQDVLIASSLYQVFLNWTIFLCKNGNIKIRFIYLF